MAHSNVLSIFYGYPAETIAKWCGVSLNTARAYKSGRRKPSAAVTRLFLLHRDLRVLGPDWEGWLVKRDVIVDPEGNETTCLQLRNYFWVMQFARHLCGQFGTQEEFYALIGGPIRAPAAAKATGTVLPIAERLQAR